MMIVQLAGATPFGHTGGATGVFVLPSTTVPPSVFAVVVLPLDGEVADMATGAVTATPRTATATTNRERVMFSIEHDPTAEVAV
jgi:hypothetical protein